ncbi:Disease resistance protein RPM1 [Vitis vinifera]|uniref:Disease resistance protein RPM1 n=1 Tax=Vitis vinifera TaxID=29760 RepID=A0A438I5K5_VITVI|nr:Disease resistance protein RPM1 [Vitis vinifera]
MLRGNSTVEMREEAKRISMEGREEEAREILTKLNDTKWVAELAVWRVIEKLNVVLIEEPAVLVGVEEVQWIQKKLMRLGVIYGYDFTEELMDVAYDFKDVIDDLSNIPHLPHARVVVPLSLDAPQYLEEMECSPMFSIQSQNLENAVVSPVEEKVSALLALEALHPDSKKAVTRLLDKFRSLDSFLKGLESVEIDDRGMIQKLSISKPQKDAQELGQSRKLKSRAPILPQPTTQKPDFASFADDVHAMMTRLLADDKGFGVITIMGMEGIGKTTLAKLIFNNKAVVDHFPFRVWTSTTACSTLSDFHQILVDMMEQLMNYKMRVTRDAWVSIEDMQKLKAFLIDNRSLIVMDDAYNFFSWHDLFTMLGDTSNGTRMIRITREMGHDASNPKTRSDFHPIRLRENDESWALFTHALKVNIPPELQELKEKIVRRCEGLPLLIVKLAEALSHKDATIEERSSVLQQLCHDQEKVWSNTLCRIYTDLSFYMRRCLFSLTLFPRDLDIPSRRLIALWVAEDLVQTAGKNGAPEDVAESCLHLLIAFGMVQVTKKKLNGNVKTIHLPNALRQYWLSQATTLRDHIYTRSELFLGNDMIRRLVDHLDQKDISFEHIHGGYNTSSTSLTHYYQNVLSFQSFDTRRESKPGEEVGNFLRRCISSSCFLLLRVLDLENVFRPNLLEALGELTRLRYLGLRSTFLEMLPSSISKLQKLQTLDLKHTNISTLPNSIWKLRQLQHLYFSEGYRSKLNPQPSIGSLTTLQTLCGLFVDEETPVRDGLNRLLNLRKLGLTVSSQPKTMSSQLQVVADWVLNLNHLRSLRVKSIDTNNQPWDLELKPLTGNSMLCSLGGFPRLRVLKLWKLDQLGEWSVEKGALQALRDLEIRYCERLPMLPAELLHRTFLKIEVEPANVLLRVELQFSFQRSDIGDVQIPVENNYADASGL